MRNRFINRLLNYCKNDDYVFLLSGDLVYTVLEPFIDRYPENFFNIGVAEQNMVGIAAGLALENNKVFTYSISNFATSRCHEQIRNDVCYHNLDVTIVAVAGGLAYGSHGYTHHGIEDIAIMRCLPNMTIFVPSDRFELDYCFKKIIKNTSPKYLRLVKNGEPNLYSKAISGHANIIQHRKIADINILACGSILKEAIDCCDFFEKQGQNIGLYSCPIISPDTTYELKKLLKKKDIFLTLEEHKKIGGFGSYVSEISASFKKPPRVIMCGVANDGYDLTGSQSYLRSLFGIDSDSLIKKIEKLL